MASPFNPLIDVIHSATTDSWKERNGQALAALIDGLRFVCPPQAPLKPSVPRKMTYLSAKAGKPDVQRCGSKNQGCAFRIIFTESASTERFLLIMAFGSSNT